MSVSSSGGLAGAVDAPYDPTSMGGGMGGAVTGSQDLGKDAFLRLLITQLSNQDPLAPTDPTQFVSQLAQFTSLEQLVGVNEGLDVLTISQTAATSAQMVSFVGQDVWIDDSTFIWDAGDESEELHFSLDEDASKVTVQVKDESGEVVRTLELGAKGEGEVVVDFDGKDDDGNPIPAGSYSFAVSAEDSDGDPIGVETKSKGHVSGVTFQNGYPQLMLEDGREISLGQVLQVAAPTDDGQSSAGATGGASASGGEGAEQSESGATETETDNDTGATSP